MSFELFEILKAGESKSFAVIDRKKLSIGRDSTCELILQRDAVSREHGVFLQGDEDFFFYKDLGSTNGSWVNGEKIEAAFISPLTEGDYIQIADTVFFVESKRSREPSFHGTQSGNYLFVLEGEQFREKNFFADGEFALVFDAQTGKTSSDISTADKITSGFKIVSDGSTGVICSLIGSDTVLYHNKKKVSEPVTLQSRDSLAIKDYRLVYLQVVAEAEESEVFESSSDAGAPSESSSDEQLEAKAEEQTIQELDDDERITGMNLYIMIGSIFLIIAFISLSWIVLNNQ